MTAYHLIYVDDIILTTSSPILLHKIIAQLHSEFSMKDLGHLHHFLAPALPPLFIYLNANISLISLIVQVRQTAILLLHMLTSNPNFLPKLDRLFPILQTAAVLQVLYNISLSLVLNYLMLLIKSVFTCIIHVNLISN